MFSKVKIVRKHCEHENLELDIQQHQAKQKHSLSKPTKDNRCKGFGPLTNLTNRKQKLPDCSSLSQINQSGAENSQKSQISERQQDFTYSQKEFLKLTTQIELKLIKLDKSKKNTQEKQLMDQKFDEEHNHLQSEVEEKKYAPQVKKQQSDVRYDKAISKMDEHAAEQTKLIEELSELANFKYSNDSHVQFFPDELAGRLELSPDQSFDFVLAFSQEDINDPVAIRFPTIKILESDVDKIKKLPDVLLAESQSAFFGREQWLLDTYGIQNVNEYNQQLLFSVHSTDIFECLNIIFNQFKTICQNED